MASNTKIHVELSELVPHGFLAARAWLMEKGMSRHSLDNLVKSGQLVSLVSGVYKQPETVLRWQGVVCSLQRMGYDHVVGGLTAFDVQGVSHYLSISAQRSIHLHGYHSMPSWVNKLGLDEAFVWHGNARLWGAGHGPLSTFNLDMPWGDYGHVFQVSSLERAICEVLAQVPEKVSFEHAEQLMQGLTTLSPRRLDEVLHRLQHVKAKRLFFWLAERQGHAWFSKLDPDRFDLGRGKRVLVKGGKLDKKYLITVPDNMHG